MASSNNSNSKSPVRDRTLATVDDCKHRGGQKAAKNTKRNLCMACDWSVLVTLYKLRLFMSYRSLRYQSERYLYFFFIGYTEEPKHNT